MSGINDLNEYINEDDIFNQLPKFKYDNQNNSNYRNKKFNL